MPFGRDLRKRSEAPKSLDLFINVAENITKKMVKFALTDGAKEKMSKELGTTFSKRGKTHEPTPPYLPQSSFRAETLNQTLDEGATTISSVLK